MLRVAKLVQHRVIVAQEGTHARCQLEATPVGPRCLAAVRVVAEIGSPALKVGVVLDSSVYEQTGENIRSGWLAPLTADKPRSRTLKNPSMSLLVYSVR